MKGSALIFTPPLPTDSAEEAFSIYMLIRCRADLNGFGHGPDAETPLGWLIKYGGNRLYTVVLLLESGADPNLPNRKGETPLMHAACSDRSDLLQTLLMFGADPEHKDQQGLTTLDHAKKEKRQQAIVVLEKNSDVGRGRAVQVMDQPFQLRYIDGA